MSTCVSSQFRTPSQSACDESSRPGSAPETPNAPSSHMSITVTSRHEYIEHASSAFSRHLFPDLNKSVIRGVRVRQSNKLIQTIPSLVAVDGSRCDSKKQTRERGRKRTNSRAISLWEKRGSSSDLRAKGLLGPPWWKGRSRWAVLRFPSCCQTRPDAHSGTHDFLQA